MRGYPHMKKNNQFTKASLLMAAASSGIVASSQAATIYDESIGGDLANTSVTATVLTSGTDSVIGTLDDPGDRSDHFIIGSLSAGGLAIFDWNYAKNDEQLQVGFTFSDPAGAQLHSTGFLAPDTNSGSTPSLTVPASGQVRVSVEYAGSWESGETDSSWGVSTTDVVPEPSTSALVALGSLLALRRRR